MIKLDFPLTEYGKMVATILRDANITYSDRVELAESWFEDGEAN